MHTLILDSDSVTVYYSIIIITTSPAFRVYIAIYICRIGHSYALYMYRQVIKAIMWPCINNGLMCIERRFVFVAEKLLSMVAPLNCY